MKTKEQIVSEMCFTMRHDYGLNKTAPDCVIEAGMTDSERQFLRAEMSQLYDHHIAPLVKELEKTSKELNEYKIRLQDIANEVHWQLVPKPVSIPADCNPDEY